MPSKYGFGNTRKKSPHRLASYGGDQKNPIKFVKDKRRDKAQVSLPDLKNLYSKYKAKKTSKSSETPKQEGEYKGSNIEEIV